MLNFEYFNINCVNKELFACESSNLNNKEVEVHNLLDFKDDEVRL